MDEKKLEQEYRELKLQAAPDLWDRIEGNLAEHPERDGKASPVIRRIPRRMPAYGMAAAAVMAVVVVAGRNAGSYTGAKGMKAEATVAAAEQAAPEAEFDLAEGYPVDAGQETVAGAAGAAGGENANAGVVGGENANAGAAADGAEGGISPEGIASGNRMLSAEAEFPEGVLTYESLDLAVYQPLAVPEQALTVPEDSEYFSEAILGDTGLLCGGTVTGVSLEKDGSGRAVKVVYEICVDQVYYSEDYTTGMDAITVKSPIVETEGDEAYILYQLQEGGTYLLPLLKAAGGWELLYPFAPQIQVTGDGAYLFHSGYASLVGGDTSVVIGSQEGANDFYYDRMLLRKDGNFLSDLVSLIEREAQGRK